MYMIIMMAMGAMSECKRERWSERDLAAALPPINYPKPQETKGPPFFPTSIDGSLLYAAIFCSICQTEVVDEAFIAPKILSLEFYEFNYREN